MQMNFTNQTLSQLLVLFLCGISCIRFFFFRTSKRDTLAILPSFALVSSILVFFAYGISIFQVAILFISLLVFIFNFRSLLRLFNGVYIDRYSILFILSSVINFILTVLVAVAVIYFHPIKAKDKNLNVQKTQLRYSGSPSKGYKVNASPFEKITVNLWKIESTEHAEYKKLHDNERIIIFLPSKCADLETYEAFFNKLAYDGFTVYAGEIFSDEIEWFSYLKDSRVFRKSTFLSQRLKDSAQADYFSSYKKSNFIKEFESLLKITAPSENNFVCIAGENLPKDVLSQVQADFPDLVDCYFDLSSVEDFKTPGFGPVENYSPLLCEVLQQTLDKSFYTSVHLATVLEKTVYFKNE